MNLSLQLYNLGLYQKSIQAAKKSLSFDPKYIYAFNNICAAYNKLGMYNKGIANCKQALEINPNYQLAQGNLEWAKHMLRQASQQSNLPEN